MKTISAKVHTCIRIAGTCSDATLQLMHSALHALSSLSSQRLSLKYHCIRVKKELKHSLNNTTGTTAASSSCGSLEGFVCL